MLLPIVDGGNYGKLSTYLGLTIYDMLASVTKEERKSMLSKKEIQNLEPLLDNPIVQGGFLYSEYRTDDARLTISVIKTAAAYGAIPTNYMEVNELLYENKKICGVACIDALTGTPLQIMAKQVVNAAGPWVDQIRKKDRSLTDKYLHHTKGIHLVVKHEQFPVRESIYFDAFDGRMIFAIPRGKTTYIGTTDTNYKGNLTLPKVSKEDATYLLKAVNHMFPTALLKPNDIVSSWAGIRPLIHEEDKGPSEISRKDEVFVSHSGMISIAGGKLTGFRKMALRTVDKVMEALHKQNGYVLKTSETHQLTLCGGDISNLQQLISQISTQLGKWGLTKQDAEELVRRYGTDSKRIADQLLKSKTNNPNLELALSELKYCIENESVHHLDDFIVQRTGWLYFNIESIAPLLNDLTKEMGAILNWDEEQTNREKELVRNRILLAKELG
jgi:glycerol-3-phosphate dehydrogenase